MWLGFEGIELPQWDSFREKGFCDWVFQGKELLPYSPYYDLDATWIDTTESSIFTNCDSSSDDSVSVKRNAVGDIAPTSRPSKNLSVDKFMLKMAPHVRNDGQVVSRDDMSKLFRSKFWDPEELSGVQVQLKKIPTESFHLETADPEFSGVQLKKTMENGNLSNIASSYPKRAKTHHPTTSLSSNLELEHKVQTLRNKATALRGLLKLIQIPENGLLEMDHLLTVICETFSLPLAQYWVTTDPYVGPLRVMCQKGNTKFENLTPWCEFKGTCLQTRLNIGEGLVGKTYLFHKSFFCRDIIELSTTNQPLSHYSLNCGSIACFTICLRSIFPKYRECVLEFFLPSQEMDRFYPQTLLNSLLATMKEHLPYYMVASGEQLGQVLSVDVINTSTAHNGPESFKIGQPKSSLSYHGDSKNEGNILCIEKSNLAMNSDEATTSGCSDDAEEMSEGTPNNFPVIICRDELEEVSPSMLIEPQSLASQPKRSEEILEDDGNTLKIDHSAMEMNSEEAIQHKEHIVAENRGDELEKESPIKYFEPQSLTSQPNRSEKTVKEIGNTAEIDHSAPEITFEEASNHKEQTEAAQKEDEPIKESPVEDVVYATSNEDVKYAKTIAFEPSGLQTMTLLPRDQVEEDTMVLQDEGDASQQLPSNLQPLFRDGTEEDEQVLDITESTPNINPYEEIAIFDTSKRQPDNVEDIICLDELGEKSSIQCTEPRSLTPESKRTENILENDENIVERDLSFPEMILEEAIQHRGHTVADQGEAHTSKRENMFEKDISYESLSQHFGRSLDDARKIFGVSRTAFKKKCRDVGIPRWKYGKRNMGPNSSKSRRRINDEVAGRRNFSSGMPPVQDTPVVSHTSQDLKKMAVKATYNGVPIRFNLPDLLGLSELQDNVIKRLHLERNSFSIKYQDDEGEWVLIACDEDVQDCVEYSRSLKKTTIKMLLDPPVDHYAP